MKFLDKVTKNKNKFQRLVGIKPELLTTLTKRLEAHWEALELKAKTAKDRKRAIGAGHPYKLESLEEKLIVVLLYYKLYVTQELLGLIVGLDQSNVSRLLNKMASIIEKAADPELATYLQAGQEDCKRLGSWSDFIVKYPDLKDVSTDATEQQVFRPFDEKQQKEHFSGKKKRHTVKTQISVSTRGRVIHVSQTYPGSVHDKK